MSNTYSLPFRRRLLRGTSGPMAVTATRANAAAAYAAMAAATWTEAEGTASDLPPHKWSQTGFRDEYDAFKYCGDYEGSTARQKAYCGAVCYSCPLPAAAADGISAYSLESVSATCHGDRWLADGCRLDLFVTDSADPPSWAAILAGTGRVATTGDPPAADAADTELPRPFRLGARSNDGPDDSAEATLAVAGDESTGSVRYLHLVLRLGDYTTVPQINKNGVLVDSAWIEGGAMLSASSAKATFSRAVVLVDEPAAEVCPLDVGIISSSYTGPLASALYSYPAVSVRAKYQIQNGLSFDRLASQTIDAICRNVTAMALAQPDIYAGDFANSGSTHISKEIYSTDAPTIGIDIDKITACSLSFSGPTGGRVFSRLRLANPISAAMPFRIVVFGIRDPICLVKSNSDRSGTPLLSWKTIFDNQFLSGSASSIRSVGGVSRPGEGASDLLHEVEIDFRDDGDTVDIPGVTLAAFDCQDGRLSSIAFSRPFETGMFSTVLLSLIPNGRPFAPSDGSSVSASMWIMSYEVEVSSLNLAAHAEGTEWEFISSGTQETTAFVTVSIDARADIGGRNYACFWKVQFNNQAVTAAISQDRKSATLGFTLLARTQRLSMHHLGEEVSVNASISGATFSGVVFAAGASKASAGSWTTPGNKSQSGSAFTLSGKYGSPLASSTIDPGYPILE